MSVEVTSIHHLSEVLCYNTSEKKHGNLEKALREYQFLINLIIEANQKLQEGELEQFDSLVGENACQIRALKIAKIFKRKSVDFYSLKEKAEKSNNRVNEILNSKTIEILKRKGDSLQKVLFDEEIDVELTSDELFMLYSFVLTKMKENTTLAKEESKETLRSLTLLEKTSPQKILPWKSNISGAFVKNLAIHIKKQLSEASVRFIQEEAEKLDDPTIAKMVSSDFVYKHQASLECIPLFWTMKTILQSASADSIPFLIHAKLVEKELDGYKVAHHEYVPFEVDASGTFSSVKLISEKIERTPVFIIEGVALQDHHLDESTLQSWRSRFHSYSFVDLILFNAAAHRQYPDPSLDAKLQTVEDLDYETYRAGSSCRGFSLDNPTTFMINHIYVKSVHRV
ncbi:MAG: hypothetical protein K2X08_07700 [Chlamydiales bacterium]|nr:hypothetical protein [Chlamydiales bacterium]MBY0529647.1 hypothetical protein [Rhabdochlamydiaceae bacterium]